jgi:hypothetical protein
MIAAFLCRDLVTPNPLIALVVFKPPGSVHVRAKGYKSVRWSQPVLLPDCTSFKIISSIVSP